MRRTQGNGEETIFRCRTISPRSSRAEETEVEGRKRERKENKMGQEATEREGEKPCRKRRDKKRNIGKCAQEHASVKQERTAEEDVRQTEETLWSSVCLR